MTRIVLMCFVFALAGCGLGETTTAAATGAAAKAEEARQAEKTLDQMQDRIDEVNRQTGERARLDDY
jgi:hypothetical protein